MVSAIGIERVVVRVEADEYSLVCIRSDLCKKFRGGIAKGWLMIGNVYEKFLRSNETKLLRSDNNLITIFIEYDKKNKRKILLLIRKSIDPIILTHVGEPL